MNGWGRRSKKQRSGEKLEEREMNDHTTEKKGKKDINITK